MKEIIISCFPGMRKDDYVNMNTKDYINLKIKDPKILITEIQKNKGKKKLITIPSKNEIREKLVKENIKFIYVLPTSDRKNDFLCEYKERGFSEEFIKNIELNWDNWMMISAYNNQYPVYFAKYGYLKDNIERILQEYLNFYKLK
ncbi:MAG: hypothetical protein IJ880_00485 [Bacilli bacterium]|nr:hypothetical protein [Bacilli bacterium]